MANGAGLLGHVPGMMTLVLDFGSSIVREAQILRQRFPQVECDCGRRRAVVSCSCGFIAALPQA